jgi:histidinol-phosphate aminotransferase
MPERGEMRLHLNENPYGPGRRVKAALRHAVAEAHLYPDLLPLRTDIGARWGVGPEEVAVGAGGDDILRRAVDATAGAVVAPWPSFSVYRILASARGRTFATSELTADLAADPAALRRVAEAQGRPGTILLANPNNPTGGARPRADYLAIAAALPAWLVVIDEAYGEFRAEVEPQGGVAEWPENVVVAKTFSKLQALAGLRVGYAVGPGWALRAVARMGDEMAVGTMAAAAARAALADASRLARVRALSLGRRRQLTEALRARAFRVGDSQTNFLLAQPPAGIDADELRAALAQEGIRTRRGADLGAPGQIRLSLPSGPQQRLLLATLDRLLAERQRTVNT